MILKRKRLRRQRKKLEVFPIPLLIQILLGDETKRGGVDAVTKSCWGGAGPAGGAVGEEVTQVRAGLAALHLGPFHAKTVIFVLNNILRFEWASKAGPSGPGIELVEGTEKRLA